MNRITQSNSPTPNSTKGQLLILLSILFCTTALAIARPVPQDVHNPIPLHKVGEGNMTWWGFTLYNASLWTATGTYEKFENSLPVALHITYKKNILSEKLVETTVNEWKRLAFFDDQRRRYWGQQLATLWPDVKPEDSITTLVTTSKHTLFYTNGKLVGRIENPELSFALLSIWLHPDTVAPKLRARLTGKLKV
jgi:hypothetical protein